MNLLGVRFVHNGRIMSALIALCSLLIAGGAQDAPIQKFTSKELAIELDLPKDWKVTRRRGGEVEFTVPLGQGIAPGEIELFPTDYRGETGTWQTIQKGVAENMKHKVERQWEEELLGVPLLLTKTTYSRRDVAWSTLTGLLYSDLRFKIHFRASAPEAGYDTLDLAWRRALETIRTTSGQLPQAGSPDRPVISNTPPKPPKTMVIRAPEETTKGIVKAPVVVEANDGENQVFLRIPEGWTSLRDESGRLSLSHPDLSGPVVITIQSVQTGGPPPRAIMKLSGDSLRRFEKVDRRTEPAPKVNRAGSVLLYILREGRGEGGALATMDALGASEENGRYWLASYTSKATLDPKATALLVALFEAMSVETSR